MNDNLKKAFSGKYLGQLASMLAVTSYFIVGQTFATTAITFGIMGLVLSIREHSTKLIYLNLLAIILAIISLYLLFQFRYN